VTAVKLEQGGTAGGRKAAKPRDKLELIRAYKRILHEALNARPVGVRLRIAGAIGTNKSFVSQITNPRYKTPLPGKYVDPLLDAVQPTRTERERFLELYRAAHPVADQPAVVPLAPGDRVLRIELPRLGSKTLEQRVDALVLDLARQVNDLVGGAGSGR
jgi:hypothetical protein